MRIFCLLLILMFCICMYCDICVGMCVCVRACIHVEAHDWCQIVLDCSLLDTSKHWTQNLPVLLIHLVILLDYRLVAKSGFYMGAGLGDPNFVLTPVYGALYLPSLQPFCVLIFLGVLVAHWPEHDCPLRGSGLLKPITNKYIFVCAFQKQTWTTVVTLKFFW